MQAIRPPAVRKYRNILHSLAFDYDMVQCEYILGLCLFRDDFSACYTDEVPARDLANARSPEQVSEILGRKLVPMMASVAVAYCRHFDGK